LPEGHHFIGVWSFDAEGVIADGIDLSVRYDEGLAAELGLDESMLKLWAFNDGKWLRVIDDSFWRDTDANLIGGNLDAMQFFAVSAPEPGGGLLVFLACAAALRRDRRRSRKS
jgi:hypothetical protein